MPTYFPNPPIITPTHRVKIHDSMESPSAELYYLVQNTEDETVVYGLVQSVLQPSYFGFFLTDYTFTHLGAGNWEVAVTYSGTLPTTDGSLTYELDFTGGTERRRQSLLTTTYASGGAVAPDFQGAINVHDGQVEGVDVIVPVLMVTVTQYFDVNNLIPSQLQAIMDLTGTVCEDSFILNFNDGQTLKANPGEALFMGGVVKQKGRESWCFSWKFQFGKTRTYNIGSLPAITKKPFDYLWVYYQPGTSNNVLVRQPYCAYVEKVYPDGDYGELGVGAALAEGTDIPDES